MRTFYIHSFSVYILLGNLQLPFHSMSIVITIQIHCQYTASVGLHKNTPPSSRFAFHPIFF